MTYLLLLRGINVGGHNKVVMKELKVSLTHLGFNNVVSYINSGNLIFESPLPQSVVADKVNQLLATKYEFPIVSLVINEYEYKADLKKLPTWWGADEALRHNALFLLPGVDRSYFDMIKSRIGEYDQVEFRDHVILWTSTLKKDFSKSLYSKLMKERFYKDVTIRNRNTALKLLTLVS
ncbi:DUF1697 domain-containing protein [Paucilactobacillus kaifaensis]|uniref:DUF1697 domain-containing protein n=1 Tax=Paucilactobacillus kaifaensis TaxID=2559921 RepID=UPI001CC61085|nr:DUF1697 domain-containing protein [Paucilactobacillus kaifaensis]